MENKNLWHIEPQGSTLERAIINTLNFITGIVFETIVKPNRSEVERLKSENEQLKQQTSEDNETILDHEFRIMELEG